MALTVVHLGARSQATKRLIAASNRRLKARGLGEYVRSADTMLDRGDLRSIRKAAWALGAQKSTCDAIISNSSVSIGVQRLILNPGKRKPKQLDRARKRMSHLRAVRRQRARAAHQASSGRLLVARMCLQAAENYRRNPGAYHYLAGGIANLVFLTPTPRTYRSDCSQFASSVQKAAKLPDLGPNGPLWVNTVIMAGHLERTTSPDPGDFGMYGSPPHHVEVYLGAAGGPGHEFVGHGSAPVDSLTPGRPDYYLKNPLH